MSTVETTRAAIAALDAEESTLRGRIRSWGGEAGLMERCQLNVIDEKRWPLKAQLRALLNGTLTEVRA